MFSKACEYGMRAAIYIAANSEKSKVSSLNEIAEAIDSPVSFTAKILQLLVREKIIKSSRGAYGGFAMNPNNFEKMTIDKIINAIDGDKVYKGCGLGLKDCSELHPCPVHDNFKKVRDDLKLMLETTTIMQLAVELQNGNSILRRV